MERNGRLMDFHFVRPLSRRASRVDLSHEGRGGGRLQMLELGVRKTRLDSLMSPLPRRAGLDPPLVVAMNVPAWSGGSRPALHGYDLPSNNSRPISMRRISLVPAPIALIFASTKMRPVGTSWS